MMDLRHHVLIRQGALNAQDLDELRGYLQHAQHLPSLVSNFDESADPDAVEWIVNRNIRDTQEVQLSAAVMTQLSGKMGDCVRDHINPFYGVTVRDHEPLQILHYGVGGHYVPHVDAETLYKDDDGLDLWEKTLDRDLSVVCFLNDDFAGGELVFPALDLIIKPEAGTLVCFPSDHNYIHGVNPVTAGERYTLVTWMRVEGTPSMEEINQRSLGEYQRAWPRQIEQPPRLHAAKR